MREVIDRMNREWYGSRSDEGHQPGAANNVR